MVKVLVIEDGVAASMVMQHLISSFAEVDVAHSYDEAKVLLSRHAYYYVICDWNLGPGRNHKRDAEELHRRGRGAEFVFISVDPDEARPSLSHLSVKVYDKDDVHDLVENLKKKLSIIETGSNEREVHALEMRRMFVEVLEMKKDEFRIIVEASSKEIISEVNEMFTSHWRRAGNVNNQTDEIDYDAASHAYQLGRAWRFIKKNGLKGLGAIIATGAAASWGWIKNPFGG